MNTKIKAFIKTFLCFSIFLFIISFAAPSASTKAATQTTLKVKSTTMYVNGSYSIALKNKKAKATYTYTSNKTSVAKVNAKGVITAVGKGSARIKVRYKLKGNFKSVGTFKVTVLKATLKSSYKKSSAIVGDTIQPSSYLDNSNPKATYIISSTTPTVASGCTEGAITATKAGKTTLSIHEVYNSRSRTIGKMTLTVTGASLKTDSIKMSYLGRLDTTDMMDDIDDTATYTLTPSNSNLLYADDSNIVSLTYEDYEQTCNVTIEETAADGTKRTIGTIKVVITNNPFISAEHQNIYIGLGSTLSLNSTEGIVVTNQQPDATYSFVPADTSIISSDMIALSYGTTSVQVIQTLDGVNTTLSETVSVTVTTAIIKDELSIDGFTTMVDGDIYGDYPVSYRNHNKIYYYEAADSSICTVSTPGTTSDQDYMIVNPRKIGQTSITVYEKESSTSSVKSKVGSFRIIVKEDTSVLPDISELVASDIISHIFFTKNNKTFEGVVQSSELSCAFSDDEGGFLDYGTNFTTVTSGNFSLILKKSKYQVEKIEGSNDGYEWTFTINLGDADGTTVDVPVSLSTADMSTASLFKNIKIKLGSYSRTLTSSSTFSYDSSSYQFDGANKDFEVLFKSTEYIGAGATEYSSTATNPVPLSSLKNVSCTVTQNEYSSTSPNASSTIASITGATTDDNAYWTFSVTFEDGTTEDFSITLGLEDEQ